MKIKLCELSKIKNQYKFGDCTKISNFSKSDFFKGKAVSRISISKAMNNHSCRENTLNAIFEFYKINKK